MDAADRAMGPPEREVRKAEPGEARTISRALADAFQEDPVLSWLIRDASRRPRILAGNFNLLLERVWLEHEETYTTHSAAGAAIWAPPGTWKVGIARQLAIIPRALAIWGRLTPRAVRTLWQVERGHPEQDHYYLAVLGVERGSQGRGLGSLLMHPVLERCDAERVPAYLEASSPRNRSLYERHGFEVTEVFELADAPPVWGMWRDPG
jgi:GNAT superfamily N-acetyltransferase